jgi:hypothetical protein
MKLVASLTERTTAATDVLLSGAAAGVVIYYKAVALLIAFAAYLWLAVSGTVSGAEWMAAGVAVSLIAAAIQPIKRLRFAVFWEFDRNGLFHLVQVAGLILLCVGLVQS